MSKIESVDYPLPFLSVIQMSKIWVEKKMENFLIGTSL